MRMMRLLIASAFIVLAICGSFEMRSGKASRKETAFATKIVAISAPASARSDLPNVLLIGDSISVGYTEPTRELLSGIANVYRVPVNGASTIEGKKNLDQWVAGRRWDVIHFNFGLHDLYKEKGRLPFSKRSVRVKLDDYAANTRAICRRLKQTGARLIFATTTPVPPGAIHRGAGEENAYNGLAQQIMREEGIAIDDLHAFAAPHLAAWQMPNDVHFKPEGDQMLARQVARAVATILQRELPSDLAPMPSD
jgi:hypothetical protein